MFIRQPHTYSISANIEDEHPITPNAPRGKRSDVSEKDLEEFTRSFSECLIMAGHLE